MSDAHAHPDEPHLPHGSVWPFWVAIGIALVGLGGIFPGVLTVIGFVALLIPLFGWFVQDYKWWNTNTGTGLHIPRAGTLLFIGSEVFLFGALFSSYFTFRDQADHWPDSHVELPLLTTFIFTAFLLSSSFTIHVAEKHLKRGDKKAFNTWWGLSILLGLIFLAGQVYEYYTLITVEHATLGSGQFITSFYMLTGTHGLHVFGGLVFLTIVWIRSLKGQFTAERHAGPENAALYWHFVDLVWLVVMPTMYLLSGAGHW